ncbi:MAG: M16 family metallopeptidase [bacterium]
MKIIPTKNEILLILVLVLCFIGCFRLHERSIKNRAFIHPSQLEYPPLEFTPPIPERHVLDNGMVIFLLPDHEIPLISISAIIRTGSVYEPEFNVGLADITGHVMRTGGTEFMEPEEINKKLEFVAATIETSIERESGSAYLSVLKKDIDLGMEIFSHILRYPKFRQDKLDIAKQQSIESIRRRNDDPMSIASREFKKLIYEGDPRSRVPSIKGIEKITQEDLIKFHHQYFFPNNIILAISGDFTKDEILGKLSVFLGDWKARDTKIGPAPVPHNKKGESIVYGERPLPQSTIVSGHLAIPNTHPDYYSFNVLNFILGDGGFGSRLVKEIRSNQGLAYSVGSFYRAEKDYGVFGTYCLTKSSSTARVIDLVKQILDDVKSKGVTEEELKWAKQSIINKFIFSFSSSGGLVKKYANLEYNQLPMDYLKDYCKKIERVSLYDIQQSAEKYLHPHNTAIVVVGDSEHFDEPLSKYGTVIEADLSIF